MQQYVIMIDHNKHYSLDEVVSIIELSMEQVQYWVREKQIPITDGKILGQFVTQMMYWQDERNLKESVPQTPREEFLKLAQLLINLRNSSRASYLFGDYRVNEMSLDLVDLLSSFVNSYSVRRIKSSAEDIYKKINTAPYSEDIDFTRFEGNISHEDAANFYQKLMSFRVMNQGREVVIERFKDSMLNCIRDYGYKCKAEFQKEENADGVIRVRLSGKDAGEIAKEYITSYGSGVRHVRVGLNEYQVFF
ncbi:hypothetical protein [Desulforamulus aquiferis]|uniref:Uncharacterized protein n=1 Tax=Desulforamulus aquiferis TaxID=1397668 RepID=A0AAW7Z9H2_9FIRM|nr:hypothetical protein [Desulforamulus aquiferis]MDO7786383.1 hypothetical protein [Desulforamulus aquiferis]